MAERLEGIHPLETCSSSRSLLYKTRPKLWQPLTGSPETARCEPIFRLCIKSIPTGFQYKYPSLQQRLTSPASITVNCLGKNEAYYVLCIVEVSSLEFAVASNCGSNITEHFNRLFQLLSDRQSLKSLHSQQVLKVWVPGHRTQTTTRQTAQTAVLSTTLTLPATLTSSIISTLPSTDQTSSFKIISSSSVDSLHSPHP